jgi:DNA-binding MarR family transcriptional regulator
VPATSDELYAALERFVQQLTSLTEPDALDALLERGLTFSQIRTLFAVSTCATAVPISEVAQARRMSVAGTGRSIDGLVHAGLVERREDENDRRVRLVSLSDAGRELVGRHLDSKRQALKAFAEQLSAADRDRLHAALVPILAESAARG